MSDNDNSPIGETLSPLPPYARDGIIAITVLAFVSFLTSSTLFVYLVYKLIAWRLMTRKGHFIPDDQVTQREAPQRIDQVILGVDGIFDSNDGKRNAVDHANENRSNDDELETSGKRSREHGDQARDTQSYPSFVKLAPNQFIVLFTNLLLADMHQSLAFMLSLNWLLKDGIINGTSVCFAQGIYVSIGDLASAMFILIIAIHTFVTIVFRYQVKHWVLYTTIVAVWIFVLLISTMPIVSMNNGEDVGGYFVRVGAWCWVTYRYESLRFSTHFVFIYAALALVGILYPSMVVILMVRKRYRKSEDELEDAKAEVQWRHEKAFLVYPAIFVLCTLPLSLGDVVQRSGIASPMTYLCFCGAMLASNGMLDAILFGTTRHRIVFAAADNIGNGAVGLDTFAFIKTPASRRYGNMIWVQGGEDKTSNQGMTGGWWSWGRLVRRWKLPRSKSDNALRSTSQESLRGPAIQMDMVTSVVVEVDGDKERASRYPSHTARKSASITSTD